LKLYRFAVASFAYAVISGCSTGPSSAPTPPPPPTAAQILAAASAGDFTCTAANAASISFDKLIGSARLYADKCVRTKGLASFRFVVRDAATMPAQKDAVIPHSAIGLYWRDDVMRKLDTGPQFVEIVGRIRSCDARNKLEQAAGTSSPTTPCRSATVAMFVSQSRVFPTAMD
jgi:hypothetical protein